MWACYRCCRSGVRRYNSRSVICRACADALHAQGLGWCSAGKHAVPLAILYRDTSKCKRCNTRTPTVPPGWIKLPALAKRLHIAEQTLTTWRKRGWPVPTRRFGRFWCFADQPNYPPGPPDKRAVPVDVCRALAASPDSCAALAARYGLHEQTVRRIRAGYRHHGGRTR